MKFTIGNKIRAGFFLTIILSLIGAAITFTIVISVNNGYSDLIHKRAKAAVLATGMRADALQKVAAFRAYIISGDAKDLDTVAECDKSFNESKNIIQNLLITDQGKESLNNLVKANDTYNKLIDKVKALKENNRNSEIDTVINNEGTADVNDIVQQAEAISNLAQQLMDSGDKEQSSRSQALLNTILYINIFSIILSVLLSLIITRIISGPISKLSKLVNTVAEGDLSVDEIHIRNKDEVGDLAKSFNKMLQNLKNVVGKVMAGSQQVELTAQELMTGSEAASTATEEIAASVENISGSVDKQKANMDNISSTIHQLSAGVEETSANMQNVSNNALVMNSLTEKGQRSLVDVVEQMNVINKDSLESVKTVKELVEMSQKVKAIVEIITGISGQTNLLALNAAIEAARAGEQGKGFAVVAEEIRKLAEQSSSSGKDITETIHNMNTEIEKVIEIIERSASEARKGNEVVQEISESFGEISNGFNGILSEVQEVSAATQEMTAGTQEVTANIDEIVGITNGNASSVHDIASSIEEQTAVMEDIAGKASILSKLSMELDSTISSFKLK